MTIDQRLSTEQCLCIIRALAPFSPAVIYIFGSFGGPAQHPESDIDIAFLPSLPAPPLDCFHISNDLANQLGHSIDLVDLKQASTVLAKEVLRTGTHLFIGNPAVQQEFEMLVLAAYARLNEERQPVLAP
jgi:predicted nucleotidyltransferase